MLSGRLRTVRILTSALLKSFWLRRRLLWRSSGLVLWRDENSFETLYFRENAPTSNPFAAAPDSGPEETPNILDLFGVGGGQADAVCTIVAIWNVWNGSGSIHTGPCCPKWRPSSTARKSFCQHDEWWVFMIEKKVGLGGINWAELDLIEFVKNHFLQRRVRLLPRILVPPLPLPVSPQLPVSLGCF